MISVPNIIKAWQERLDDYPEESMTPKLIRDTIAVLELLKAPLSKQNMADLTTICPGVDERKKT